MWNKWYGGCKQDAIEYLNIRNAGSQLPWPNIVTFPPSLGIVLGTVLALARLHSPSHPIVEQRFYRWRVSKCSLLMLLLFEWLVDVDERPPMRRVSSQQVVFQMIVTAM